VRDPNSEGKGKSPLSAIGGAGGTSPADRVRQIQQLQQITMVEQAVPHDPVQTARATQTQTQTEVAKRNASEFTVASPEAVKAALQPGIDVRHVEEVARRQVDDHALFVGNDVEVIGNPWRVIPFGDELPALFETKQPLEFYEPLVPKNAVRTPEGLLFEVALKAKDGSEQPQIRTVLTTPEGRLQGAECRTPQELQRLLNRSPGLFERLFGFALPKGGLTVKSGTQSKFQAEVTRPPRGKNPARIETTHFNNYGQRVGPSSEQGQFDFKYEYSLDAFDAGFAKSGASDTAGERQSSFPVQRAGERPSAASANEWWIEPKS
jgi:hypothetical protein